MDPLTLGSANLAPRVGPTVVSEIHYHPANPDGPGGIDADDLEFIEITNPGPGAVDLWSQYLVDGEWVDYPWTVEGYAFETGTTLAGGEALVVVRFDPVGEPTKLADFTTHHGVTDPGVQIVGPFDGKLDNAGETVRLERPDQPPAEDTDYTPYLLVDEVVYDDESPWPTEPDTDAQSLVRVSAAAWGNDPASWTAQPPSPGAVDFGPSAAPTGVDLADGSDTGQSASDNLTRLDNSADKTLTFTVTGTIAEATVTLYADDTPIGTATGADGSTLVTTNGTAVLADGARSITARQTESGRSESLDSPALTVTVDTAAPTVDGFGLDSSDAEWRIGTIDSAVWTAGRAYETAPWSTVNVLAVSFDEAVIAAAGDLTLTGVEAGAVAVTDVAGDETTDVAFTVAGTAGGYLDKDRYDVALGAGVTDIAGNPLAGWSAELALLPGDINGDGEVGSLDRRDLRNAYGSEIGHGGYSTLVDVNADGSAGSLDRRVLRNHYAESLPLAPAAAVEADPTPGGAVLVTGSTAATRTFTTANGETVSAEWSVHCGMRNADGGLDDAEAARGPAPSAAGVPSWTWSGGCRGLRSAAEHPRELTDGNVQPEDRTGAAESEESGPARAGAVRPALEPVGVFFWSDGAWTVTDESIVIDDAAASEAQLEPDLSPGLTDPLTGDAV